LIGGDNHKSINFKLYYKCYVEVSRIYEDTKKGTAPDTTDLGSRKHIKNGIR
jgi:hypothetical protein